jgi:stage V sporulation protein AE
MRWIGGAVIVWDYLKAFLVGGLLCVIGQILIDQTKLTPAKILVSYVVAGVFFGAVGIYQPFVKWAGAGASIPLTGFGNVLAQGIKKAISEKGVLGIMTGGLTAAAAGISAAIIFGYVVALIFKPKEKE